MKTNQFRYVADWNFLAKDKNSERESHDKSYKMGWPDKHGAAPY